jgi:predicted nucleotidyltransferase
MATRRAYSLDRLATLGERLDPVRPLLADKPICVYATGSYGRLEGWRGSDVDLFFLYDGDDDADRFPLLTFMRLAACLITATEDMEFAPFSRDGRYLEVLYIRAMEKVLGSPDDDSTNAFTARMLLLLESQPVYDPALYASLLKRIVGFYYRDFGDHADNFVPGFLINDILRFWRTLTLNYEHHRLKLQDLTGDELRSEKAASALKNYKLKVSRMATCFSMVANLSSEPRPVTIDTVVELCRMTPAKRLERLGGHSKGAMDIVAKLEVAYGEFLQDVQRPEDVLLEEFARDEVRADKLTRAATYGELIYELLVAVVPDERLRYLIV